MKDSFNRTIDYLRISLTDRCNLRCIYCMPEEGVAQIGHQDILRIEEIYDIVRVASEMGISKVRLTGGEPLVRKGCVELVRDLKQLPNIEDVSLTTNGLLLPRFAAELKAAGLDRVNISLDTLDSQQFTYITRLGKLEGALEGIRAAQEHGFDPIKINAVAVRSLNQDFYGFASMTLDQPLHVRFIEYMPVGSSSGGTGDGWGPDDVIPASEIIQIIDQAASEHGHAGLEPILDKGRPKGSGPAQYWRFPGAQGTVGFIHAMSNHFCAQCNRLRLTADGKLRPCLFSDLEYDVRDAVRSGSDQRIRDVFNMAIGNKPDEHHDKVGTDRKMSQIGG